MTFNDVITRLDAIATEKYPMITELDVQALRIAIKKLEQEPTTKNDLGVDCISRAYLCNRIYGIDHDEDYECDEFGGSRITYHTCDWDEVLREIADAPSVTPQEPRWIPVSERLPEENTWVLCWYKYFRYGDYECMQETYGVGFYDSYGHWGGDVSGHKSEAIAWMPLPEPYNADRSEE